VKLNADGTVKDVEQSRDTADLVGEAFPDDDRLGCGRTSSSGSISGTSSFTDSAGLACHTVAQIESVLVDEFGPEYALASISVELVSELGTDALSSELRGLEQTPNLRIRHRLEPAQRLISSP
jgi:hypothetical protein